MLLSVNGATKTYGEWWGWIHSFTSGHYSFSVVSQLTAPPCARISLVYLLSLCLSVLENVEECVETFTERMLPAGVSVSVSVYRSKRAWVACTDSAPVCKGADGASATFVCVQEGHGFLSWEQKSTHEHIYTSGPSNGVAFEGVGSCFTIFLGLHTRKNPPLDCILSF